MDGFHRLSNIDLIDMLYLESNSQMYHFTGRKYQYVDEVINTQGTEASEKPMS